MEQECCLTCKHFRIWDEDPCCLEKDEFKIVLPSEKCKKYKYEEFGPARRLHAEDWEVYKKIFFDRYYITNQELFDNYIALFPEDKDLVESRLKIEEKNTDEDGDNGE